MLAKAKRILIITNITYDLFSMRKELVESLLDHGYQIFISAILGENTNDFSEMGCNLINAPLNRRGVNPISDFRLACHYLKILRTVKPDTVLTFTIKPNVYGGVACGLRGVPYISNVTGLGTAVTNGGLTGKIAILLYRMGLRKSASVFFQNYFNLEYMLGKKVVKGKYRVIPGSGVNLDYHVLTEYPNETEGTRFLFIGRIMRDKGINELLEAAKYVKKSYPKTQFDLIGRLEVGFQSEIADDHNAGLIHFHGAQNDVRKFLQECNALVLPSYHEGLSNVLLEAASTGRPVIASNIPGCMDAFDEGVSGLGFEVKNAKDLAEKLIQFIEMPHESKRQMGLAGRVKMESEFNRSIICEHYLNEIEQTITTEEHSDVSI